MHHIVKSRKQRKKTNNKPIAVSQKADRTVYDVRYSWRTEPPKMPRLVTTQPMAIVQTRKFRRFGFRSVLWLNDALHYSKSIWRSDYCAAFSRQRGKTRWNHLFSCPVAWDIIISCLSDAISISGYIPTSDDIAVSTIEKFDLENMGIAVGIFSIGAIELEIQAGM